MARTAFLLLGLPLAAGLAAAVDDVPPPAATEPDPVFFEERIQPIFTANCGTVGCHGSPGSGRLLLERPDFAGRLTRDQLDKNRDTALQFVEFGKPLESRLILKPLKQKDGGLPHTGAQYDFGKDSEEFAIFADWVNGVVLKDVPPVADAGPDRTAKRGESIALDGSKSRERRGGELHFRWTVQSRPEGSAPLLKAADTASPTFKADQDGAYTLALTVDNGALDSAPATTTVLVDSLPFVTLEAERAQVETGFVRQADAAASDGFALAHANDDVAARARLSFTLPAAGAYDLYARVRTESAEPAPLKVTIDGGDARELKAGPGAGWRFLKLDGGARSDVLAGSGGKVISGSAAIEAGALVLRGSEAQPATLALATECDDPTFEARVACARPEVGAAHAAAAYVLADCADAGNARFAGIEVGRSRYVIGRIVDGRREILAERRAPLRPDETYALRAAFRGSKGMLLFDESEGGPLEADFGAPPSRAGVAIQATSEASVAALAVHGASGIAYQGRYDADARLAGELARGDHELVLAADSHAAPAVDQFFLARSDASGGAGGAGGDEREARALYLDLLGRVPTAIERLMARGQTRAQLVDRLLGSLEFFENLYQQELYFYLLLDNFHPRTPALNAIPARLANGQLDLRDATQEIVISQYFNARNPGNDTFVTVVLEQLLGVTVQDEPRLLEAGKKMYDGYKASVFGRSGESQSDLVHIVLAEPRYAPRLLERHYRRLIDDAPRAADLERWSDAFRQDPRGYLPIVREWLLSDAYSDALAHPRKKNDFQWIRSIFVDLLGRKPTFEEFRNFRNAVQSLADSAPLRSVLARVMLESGQVALPKKDGLDARAFVDDQFERLLARKPTAKEADAFVKALADQSCEPRMILQAILSSVEYQYY